MSNHFPSRCAVPCNKNPGIMATNLWVQSPSLIAAYGLQTGGIKGSQAPPLKTPPALSLSTLDGHFEVAYCVPFCRVWRAGLLPRLGAGDWPLPGSLPGSVLHVSLLGAKRARSHFKRIVQMGGQDGFDGRTGYAVSWLFPLISSCVIM